MNKADIYALKCCKRVWLKVWDQRRKVLLMVLRGQFVWVLVVMALIVAIVTVVNKCEKGCDFREFSLGSIVSFEAYLHVVKNYLLAYFL